MDNSLSLEQAVQVLRDENVNVALEFTQDREGFLIFNARGIPWSNSSLKGSMILTGDHDIAQAVIRLAEGVMRREWVPLNWRVRLDEPGIYTPGRQWVVLRNARSELEKLQEDIEGGDVTKDKNTPRKRP